MTDSADRASFQELAEPHRRYLHNHCYRMLGSVFDAEDALQETYLRGWKSFDGFRGASSIRTWLCSIATRTCLDFLRNRARRMLPEEAFKSSLPDTPPGGPAREISWLEPYPSRLIDEGDTPEAHVLSRETVRLAFVTVLQSLPPRQRAILLLVDVLDWNAKEVATLLNSSERAVASALRRARVNMGQRRSEVDSDSDLRASRSNLSETAKNLLERYVAAWHDADVSGLTELLLEDATFSMPPVPTWYSGRSDIAAALAGGILAGEAQARWILVPSSANSQPAFFVYQLSEEGKYRFFGVQVLELSGSRIRSVTTFLDPRLRELFGATEMIEIAPDEKTRPG